MTPPALRRGDRGPDVARWQRALVALGYELRVDEDFGPATETATKRAQSLAGLDADGAVGPATWALEPQPARIALRFEPLDVHLGDVSSDERRRTLAAIALCFDNLGAKDGPPGRADAYSLAIGDGEPPWFRREYVLTRPATNSNASSCGLVCRRVLSLAGVVDRVLEPPYDYQHLGGAIGQIRNLAERSGALRTYRGALPREGDIVQVGPYRGHPTGQHIYTVTSEDGSSLDGGQTRPVVEGGSWGGGTDVRRVARSWRVEGGRLWTRSALGERPVAWWADADALTYARGVLMPVRV